MQPKDTSKGHFYISLVKSFVRIAAGVACFKYNLPVLGVLLIVAELLGVAEEFV